MPGMLKLCTQYSTKTVYVYSPAFIAVSCNSTSSSIFTVHIYIYKNEFLNYVCVRVFMWDGPVIRPGYVPALVQWLLGQTPAPLESLIMKKWWLIEKQLAGWMVNAWMDGWDDGWKSHQAALTFNSGGTSAVLLLSLHESKCTLLFCLLKLFFKRQNLLNCFYIIRLIKTCFAFQIKCFASSQREVINAAYKNKRSLKGLCTTPRRCNCGLYISMVGEYVMAMQYSML